MSWGKFRMGKTGWSILHWGSTGSTTGKTTRFSHLPIHRKTLPSFTWDICHLWLAVLTLLPTCTLDCMYFPAKKKFMFILAPPKLLRCCFLGYRLQLSWNKTLFYSYYRSLVICINITFTSVTSCICISHPLTFSPVLCLRLTTVCYSGTHLFSSRTFITSLLYFYTLTSYTSTSYKHT